MDADYGLNFNALIWVIPAALLGTLPALYIIERIKEAVRGAF